MFLFLIAENENDCRKNFAFSIAQHVYSIRHRHQQREYIQRFRFSTWFHTEFNGFDFSRVIRIGNVENEFSLLEN